MLTQLQTPIPLETPKGKAWAVAIIDYGPHWDLLWVTEALRIPARTLTAMFHALNTTKKGDNPYTHENLKEPGKYDDLLALSSKVTANCWKLRGIVNAHKQAIEDALAEYKSRVIGTPGTNLNAITADEISPKERERSGGLS